MKDKTKKLIKNKRVLFLSGMILFALVAVALDITFSAFYHKQTKESANLKIKGMEYEVMIDGILGTNIEVKAYTIIKLNIGIKSLNKEAVKYELIYEVCNTEMCDSYKGGSEDLEVRYSSKTKDGIVDSINPNDVKTIQIVIINNTSFNEYIHFDLNSGYKHNTLTLVGAITKDYFEQNAFTDYIIDLAAFPLISGVYNEPEDDYRYEGLDPDNYIRFNNELWRIVGVFNKNTHDLRDRLVKIVRNDLLNAMAWDSNNSNNWPTSSLYNYLNETYYEQIVPSDKEMIENVNWKLGSLPPGANDANSYYIAERNEFAYVGHDVSSYGLVGLIYPSDYGYSVLSSSCPRTTSLGDYNAETCGRQSWLNKRNYRWTLTPNSNNSSQVWHIDEYGNLYYDSNANMSIIEFQPALYLKSGVQVIGGTGMINDPYIISL